MPFNEQILGTVIASMLDYANLIKITKDPTVIDPKKSSWIPADGRSVSGSLFSTLTGLNNSPDLRGRFLRGLNTIYNVGQPALDISKADEGDLNNNRKPGDYQGDSFESHTHPAGGYVNGSVCGSNNTHDVSGGGDKWNCDPGLGGHNVTVTVQAVGELETRAKNVSIYYYIKIN